jgi:hypothetical protein
MVIFEGEPSDLILTGPNGNRRDVDVMSDLVTIDVKSAAVGVKALESCRLYFIRYVS